MKTEYSDISNMHLFNVKACGAKGDGVTKETAFLQRTIDECTRAGGGIVYFPPGTYLTGTIRLKDNVTLWIEAGATIFASEDLEDDYDPVHLIYARKAKNIAICGRGTINGNFTGFFRKKEEFKKQFPIWPEPWGLRPWRPRTSVHFFCCENVMIEGITFVEGCITTLQMMGCIHVNITRIIVNNAWDQFLQDAIEILSCRQVHISNCSLSSSDDPITIYQGCPWYYYPLGDGLENLDDGKLADFPNENITISNCVLRTHCNGIRVNGSGGGAIRNVSFDNIIIDSDSVGISIKNFYAIEMRGIQKLFSWKNAGTTEIENVSFSNITVKCGTIGFYVLNEDFIGKKNHNQGNIRNISIFNARFVVDVSKDSALGTCLISGSKNQYLDNIKLSSVEIDVTGTFDKEFQKMIFHEVHYPLETYDGELYPRDDWMSRASNPRAFPYGVYCRYAKDVRFHDVVMRNKSSVKWKNAVRFDHVADSTIKHLDVRQHEKNDVAMVGVYNTNNIAFEAGVSIERIVPQKENMWTPPPMNQLLVEDQVKDEYRKQFGILQ